MAVVNAYLTFEGTCEAAFNLYKSVFGGEFTYVGRYKDMPSTEHPVPDALKDKISHISLPICNECELYGADMMEELGFKSTFGDNIALSVKAKDEEETKKIFNGLAEGGTITMPLEKTFWSPMFGMLTDKFGVNWMVSYGN